MLIGTTEVLIIALAAVFLFGGKKAVDWARSLGKVKRVYDEELGPSDGKKEKDLKE